jgi:hypothetical protein
MEYICILPEGNFALLSASFIHSKALINKIKKELFVMIVMQYRPNMRDEFGFETGMMHISRVVQL